jgi:predicted enzyme related to lactoylglutathione lyase
MQRVVGLGGVFIKAKDPKKLCDWYKKHLGLNIEDWGGVVFNWKDLSQANPNAFSLFSTFKEDTKYLDPSNKPFMLNFVVNDLVKLLDELRNEQVIIVGEMEESEYGKFAWIMDIEDNKIELWQPPVAQQ